jgi:hypothetical protein
MARPTIVRLAEQDVSAAAAALARAFQDDPLQTYVFPDPVERAARSPAHFAPLLRYGLLFGEVLTTAVLRRALACGSDRTRGRSHRNGRLRPD